MSDKNDQEVDILKKDRDIKKESLFRFLLESEVGGHACRELMGENYGPEHPMGGDCKYCFYGRMSADQKRDLRYALQNAWADAEHALAKIQAVREAKNG